MGVIWMESIQGAYILHDIDLRGCDDQGVHTLLIRQNENGTIGHQPGSWVSSAIESMCFPEVHRPAIPTQPCKAKKRAWLRRRTT